MFDIDFTADEATGSVERMISSSDIPTRYIDHANRTAGQVDCTWVLHTSPNSKVTDDQRKLVRVKLLNVEQFGFSTKYSCSNPKRGETSLAAFSINDRAKDMLGA